MTAALCTQSTVINRFIPMRTTCELQAPHHTVTSFITPTMKKNRTVVCANLRTYLDCYLHRTPSPISRSIQTSLHHVDRRPTVSLQNAYVITWTTLFTLGFSSLLSVCGPSASNPGDYVYKMNFTVGITTDYYYTLWSIANEPVADDLR